MQIFTAFFFNFWCLRVSLLIFTDILMVYIYLFCFDLYIYFCTKFMIFMCTNVFVVPLS